MEVFEQVMEGLGLTPRPQQTKLVALARAAVEANTQQFVQAGTGTGKSFALLSLALETARNTGLPSIVICPNNTLIDQYCLQDAPSVGEVAGGKFVHIKGRSRYVCANSVALRFESGGEDAYARLIAGGELEWANLGLDPGYGCPGNEDCDPKATCTCGAYESDFVVTCTCPYVCGAFEARKRAEGADVVITNAHLLVWDYLVQLYTNGNVRLLPERGALFVDECHELEGVGRDCLSDEIGQDNPLCKILSQLGHWMDDRTEELVAQDLREARLTRDPAILKMAKIAQEMADELGSKPEMSKADSKNMKRLTRFVEFVEESEDFVSLIDVGNPEKTVLRRRCVNAAAVFNRILTAQPSVLVSGTIPSSDRRRLGLAKTTKITHVGHPFDYSRSKLIVSKYDPKSPTDAIYRVKSLIRAINETKGGTLVLFTSWADLEAVMPKVAMGLDRGIDVYMQSHEDPATLKQDVIDFREDGNAVLAGVRSLFTGLDIPGPALRQVVIWKLPYQVPTIEVQAIADLFGRNVYTDQMLMTLTQGIGRLVRTTDDYGRILIMDNRASKLDWSSNGMTHHLEEFSR